MIITTTSTQTKQLILIRGIPGSGKTTLAKRLGAGISPKIQHFEADMYFTNADGAYHFEPSKISEAHNWCQSSTKQALLDPKVETIIVSNTFVKLWELRKYIELAKTHGATVKILVASGNYQNVHGVPQDKIELMKKNWEDHPDDCGYHG